MEIYKMTFDKKHKQLCLRDRTNVIKMADDGIYGRVIAEKFGVGKGHIFGILKRKAEIMHEIDGCRSPDNRKRRKNVISDCTDILMEDIQKNDHRTITRNQSKSNAQIMESTVKIGLDTPNNNKQRSSRSIRRREETEKERCLYEDSDSENTPKKCVKFDALATPKKVLREKAYTTPHVVVTNKSDMLKTPDNTCMPQNDANKSPKRGSNNPCKKLRYPSISKYIQRLEFSEDITRPKDSRKESNAVDNESTPVIGLGPMHDSSEMCDTTIKIRKNNGKSLQMEPIHARDEANSNRNLFQYYTKSVNDIEIMDTIAKFKRLFIK